MEKTIIFYEDTKKSCCDGAARFAAQENVECRKISEYQDKKLIFSTGGRLGFLFESENGKVPYDVSHVIWRVVADKKGDHMIMVTGGQRELAAIRSAQDDMEKRGYHVAHIYIRYILEKYKLREENAVQWIMTDMETGQSGKDLREKYLNMPKKELRKSLHRELKAYRKYQKKNAQM
ncbi:MAG TPA: hypothetical protein H9955_17740 [Candidatus Mediterraneibacter cottocaccae]|nr:hypothetical protein [Candidatus Mediterraneibacter cottocaccae]